MNILSGAPGPYTDPGTRLTIATLGEHRHLVDSPIGRPAPGEIRALCGRYVGPGSGARDTGIGVHAWGHSFDKETWCDRCSELLDDRRFAVLDAPDPSPAVKEKVVRKQGDLTGLPQLAPPRQRT